MKKIIGYANLEDKPKVLDYDMMKYFKRTVPSCDEEAELIPIIDREPQSSMPENRDGWNMVVELCKKEKVEWIVIPSVKMMGIGMLDILERGTKLYEEYGTKTLFQYEQADIGNENSNVHFGFLCSFMLWKDQMIRERARLLDIFEEVTKG